MIIPTAEYNPMFARDGVPFREKMIDYIIREFGDTLGPQVELLRGGDLPATLTDIAGSSAAERLRTRRAA